MTTLNKYAYIAFIAVICILIAKTLLLNSKIDTLNAEIERLNANIEVLEQSNISIDLQQDRYKNQLVQANAEIEACYQSKSKLADDLAVVEQMFEDIEPVIIDKCEIGVIPDEKRDYLIDTLNDNISM